MTDPGSIARWRPLCKVRIQLRPETFDDQPPDPGPSVDPGSGNESFGLGQEHVVGGGRSSLGYDIVPLTASVELNSYRLADTCRVTIRREAMPFDPRLIRAATIQVFGGAMDSLTWARAMDGPDAPGLLLPDANERGDSNEIFRGFIDDWELNMTTDVMLTGRDFTSVFIDAELPQNALRGVSKNTRLDDAIKILLFGDGLPAGRSRVSGLKGATGTVVVNDTGAQLPRLRDIKPPSWFSSRGQVAKGRRQGKRGTQKISYWDIISDLCVAAGFICFIRPSKLVVTTASGRRISPNAEIAISNPRTYYKQSTHYGDEIVAPSDVRQFWYGINIEEDGLTVRRNFAGKSIPSTIEVRAFDPGTGTEHSARFPPRKKTNRPAVSGRGDREEVKVFVLQAQGGGRILETLDRAAQSIYEQLGRGEIEVSIKTTALATLPWNLNPQVVIDRPQSGIASPYTDPDMLRLRAGDPIFVGVDRADLGDDTGKVSSHTAFSAAAPATKIESMVRAGVRRDLATEIANASASQWIQSEFRTQRVGLSFSNDAGWNFEISAINYLDIRNATQRG